MGEYLLSIDNGLTTTKAVLFARDGREIASGMTETILENRGDQAEIDMELQWRNTVSAIKSTLSKSGVNPSEIVGIGNSGHGAGVYLLDSKGSPVRKAISSMDGRAADLVQDWAKKEITNYDQTYQHMWNGQPIPLLYWLKINEPENYQKIAAILMAKDWIKYKLTGELSTEYTDASNSGLVNLNTKSYDPQIFNPYGLEEVFRKLPDLKKSAAISGYISKQAAGDTGLKEGTPVMGGLFDVVACALGSGIYDNKQYSITAGTWNINAGVEEKIVLSPEIMEWVYYADDSKYICIDSSATSAVNLEWFVKNIIEGFELGGRHDGKLYQTIDQRMEQFKPGDVEIIYLPFIYKSKLTRKVDGGFFGIKASSNIDHLLRAVYEGVAFAHLKHLDNLRQGGIVKPAASLSGGAAKSDFWCQMFADVLNIEIITTKTSQVGALGTVISTAVAVGLFPSFEQAVKAMVNEEKRYYPNSEANRIYMEKYRKFNKIIDLYDNTIL